MASEMSETGDEVKTNQSECVAHFHQPNAVIGNGMINSVDDSQIGDTMDPSEETNYRLARQNRRVASVVAWSDLGSLGSIINRLPRKNSIASTGMRLRLNSDDPKTASYHLKRLTSSRYNVETFDLTRLMPLLSNPSEENIVTLAKCLTQLRHEMSLSIDLLNSFISPPFNGIDLLFNLLRVSEDQHDENKNKLPSFAWSYLQLEVLNTLKTIMDNSLGIQQIIEDESNYAEKLASGELIVLVIASVYLIASEYLVDVMNANPNQANVHTL